MKLLSLNIRGIGSTLKAASFRRLLEHSKPDVIFLQETLSTDHSARDFLHHFRPLWISAALSSIGNSGGMLVAWDPTLFDLTSYLTCGGILCTGRCLATSQVLTLLNVYGPCLDRPLFWTQLANSGILALPNLILGGDLNITLSADEQWGSTSISGTGLNLYRDLFNSFNLIDVLPINLVPTWRNGRRGAEAIAKRLDRFLISETFFHSTASPRPESSSPFSLTTRPSISL
jgi:hypothetical protein